MGIYKSVTILALSESEQKEYLLEMEVYPSTDELALEFSDSFKAYLGHCAEHPNSYNPDLLNRLQQIDDLLDEMSDLNSSIWDVSSLNNIYWNEIRFLANNILIDGFR